MRLRTVISFCVFILSSSSLDYNPFPDQLANLLAPLERSIRPRLKRRQDCPLNYNNCDGLDSGACCPSGTVCTTDSNNHVACCPVNAKCTGTIGAGTPASGSATTTNGGGVIVGGTTTTGTTSSLSLNTGSTTTTSNPVSVVSVVPNSYNFPFAIIPTTFANAAQCSSYYTSCQSEYATCTASLGGGANGVTVGGVGGGTTVQGATASATVNAQSICSSLSSAACHGLQVNSCSQLGTGNGNSFVVGQTNGAMAARVTGCPGGLYAMGAGMALGVAGALV